MWHILECLQERLDILERIQGFWVRLSRLFEVMGDADEVHVVGQSHVVPVGRKDSDAVLFGLAVVGLEDVVGVTGHANMLH